MSTAAIILNLVFIFLIAISLSCAVIALLAPEMIPFNKRFRRRVKLSLFYITISVMFWSLTIMQTDFNKGGLFLVISVWTYILINFGSVKLWIDGVFEDEDNKEHKDDIHIRLKTKVISKEATKDRSNEKSNY